MMMYANVRLYQCSGICNDTSASCSNYKGKAQLSCGSSIKQKHVWHEDQVMRRWMLHGNVSRKGYGNALIGRYGGCFEEDIMRLMMTERIMPRVWMHRRSFQRLSR